MCSHVTALLCNDVSNVAGAMPRISPEISSYIPRPCVDAIITLSKRNTRLTDFVGRRCPLWCFIWQCDSYILNNSKCVHYVQSNDICNPVKLDFQTIHQRRSYAHDAMRLWSGCLSFQDATTSIPYCTIQPKHTNQYLYKTLVVHGSQMNLKSWTKWTWKVSGASYPQIV